MTKQQKQQKRMATPRQTARQRAAREQYLLRELQRIGYEIAPVGRYQYFIRRAA